MSEINNMKYKIKREEILLQQLKFKRSTCSENEVLIVERALLDVHKNLDELREELSDLGEQDGAPKKTE